MMGVEFSQVLENILASVAYWFFGHWAIVHVLMWFGATIVAQVFTLPLASLTKTYQATTFEFLQCFVRQR